MTLFALIDHSGEADSVGIEMLPTKLLIFGVPKAGTALMLASPSIARSSPEDLVWQDASAKIWITYNISGYLQQRHGVSQTLVEILSAVETLATIAAK